MDLRTKVLYSDAVTESEKKSKQVAYQAALEGIVLLENDGTLPVKPGKIALFGAGASMTIKGGTGSGEVNERHSVSILEGLESSGFTVSTKPWIQEYERIYKDGEAAYVKDFRKKMLSFNVSSLINIMSNPYCYPFGQRISEDDIKNSDTDTCIYVVARQAGEGADRKLDNGDNALSENEFYNIKLCAERYRKTIVVINIGSSFDMKFLDEIEGINAVVFFCQQGSMGGKAFADLISGSETPSGKLTDTWAIKYEDIPFSDSYSYLNGNLEEEYYKEGIYVGYRYFDTFKVKPKYHFGYGLSYTDFQMEQEAVNIKQSTVSVQCKVTNSGSTYAGKEVVQLYASCPQNGLKKEYQRLIAFVKTKTLKPGESTVVTLNFKLDSLASYREQDGATVLEMGDYILRIGNSSCGTKVCAVLALEKELILSKHCHICERPKAVEEIEAPQVILEDDLSNTERLVINPEAITTITYSYEKPAVYSDQSVDSIMKKLTIEDMATLVVGTGIFGAQTYFNVPGAAGNTTSKLVDKGLINIAMADGPAGLRIQKTSVVYKNGKMKMMDAQINLINYMPNFVKKFTFGNPKKGKLAYQFTTAFPVGMALAQSWNTELVEAVGKAVSDEMTAYGATYWLAPAMNIHRNPLCGRNFEYFSEDPLISGKMAAAMTLGVQSTSGNCVTLKHFCCNNQEDSRNKTNANVNERALREIYLRGFEIAVREGNPQGIMTSYNKVNGCYTPNSYDLCTKVLRNEWGYSAMVMTDWFSTGKGLGSNPAAIAAGNDLIMPGNGSAVKEILNAVKDGSLSKEDLKRCAANIVHMILNSQVSKEYGLAEMKQ